MNGIDENSNVNLNFWDLPIVIVLLGYNIYWVQWHWLQQFKKSNCHFPYEYIREQILTFTLSRSRST